MKIDPKNKWRKDVSLSLDSSSTDAAISINGEARHKLDLSISMILEFPDLKFGPWWLGWLGFLFLQP